MAITASAGALACHVEGSGPPLVLFHGGMGSWTHWVRNIPAVRSRFTVHVPDLPGCGDSIAVAQDIAQDDYLALVYEAVEDIARGAPIDLAGFSFGGVMAAMLAARMPETVRRLALLAPGGFGMSAGRPLDLRKMPGPRASEAERDDVLRHNLMVLMLARPETADAETIAIQRANVGRARYDTRIFSMAPHTRDALPAITAPTLLIYGERDNLAWPSVQARIDACRSRKPDIRVETIPEAGHWVQYEAAQAVNRLLLDFFDAQQEEP